MVSEFALLDRVNRQIMHKVCDTFAKSPACTSSLRKISVVFYTHPSPGTMLIAASQIPICLLPCLCRELKAPEGASVYAGRIMSQSGDEAMMEWVADWRGVRLSDYAPERDGKLWFMP